EPGVPGREHGLLLAEVVDPDGQDRLRRRGLGAEPPDVGLAERALPGERLARHEPGPVAVPLPLGHLRERRDRTGHVVPARHECSRLSSGTPSWHEAAAAGLTLPGCANRAPTAGILLRPDEGRSVALRHRRSARWVGPVATGAPVC